MPLYDLYLRRNLSEPNLPLSLVLPFVPKDETTETVEAEILWRWEDEPDMKPESLGKTIAGKELTVPFDMKGRTIRLFVNSLTKDGTPSFAKVADTVQVVFGQPTVAGLVSAVFDPTPDEVELTIDNNGGEGDISILRRLGSGTFSVIAVVGYATTTYTDEPTIDGTYQYKLTQAGLPGESGTLTVEVTVGVGGSGTPPSGLTASETLVSWPPEEWDVTLNWAAGSGAAVYTVERKENFGSWFVLDNAYTATTYVDASIFGLPYSGRSLAYRVKHNDVDGYSNEAYVYIPRDTGT